MRLDTLTVHVPIWNWDMVLFDGDDHARLETVLAFLGVKEHGHNRSAQGQTWIVENLPILIWLVSRDDLSTLAHEVMHAVFGMLRQRGLKPAPESEEAYTYTVSFILDAAFKGKWQRVPKS